MRPAPVVQLPDTGIGPAPALANRGNGRKDRAVGVTVEAVMGRGSRKQQQRLAEDVELELGIRVITGDVGPPG